MFKKGEIATGLLIAAATIILTYLFLGQSSPTGLQVFEPSVVVSGCPIVINDSSTLSGNLMSNGTCIIFGTDNITLDCLGFSITGNGTGNGANATNRINVSVQNCIMTNFNININLTNTTNSSLFNNTLFNATSSGINLRSSANNTVVNNTVNNSNLTAISPGILVNNGSNNTMINNSVFSRNAEGIFLSSGSNRNTINNSNLTSIDSDAIFLDASHNNTISNNNATSTNGRGIDLSSQSSENVITNNTAVSNTFDGMFIEGNNNNITNNTIGSISGDGLKFDVATGNRLTNNTATTSSGIGINVDGSSQNIFSNNTAATNTGTALRFSSSSNNNNLTNTTLRSNSTWVSTSSSSNNQLNNTLFDAVNGSMRLISNATLPGTETVDRSNLNITFNDAFLNATDLPFFNMSAQIILHNILPDSITPPPPKVDFNDDGIFAGCPSPPCTFISYNGSTIVFNVTSFTSYGANDTFPAYITVDSNLTSNVTVNGSAIIFNASNILFNCNGFTLTGNGTGIGFNVTAVNNITIENCIITGFDNDIFFNITNGSLSRNNSLLNASSTAFEILRTNNSNVTNTTISTTASLGLNITGGNNNTVQHSNILSENSFAFAMNSGSENNTIYNNTVRSNLTEGMLFDATNFNIIQENFVNTTPGGGHALELVSSALFNSVINNTFIAESGDGIFLFLNANNNTIVNNTATSATSIAILISGSSNNTLRNNTGTGVTERGIVLTSTANNNTLTGNNGTSTSNIGINIISSVNNTLINNTGTSTSSHAFRQVGSTNNLYIGNLFRTDTGTAVQTQTADAGNNFFNTTLESNNSWINISTASTGTNFTNTTFRRGNGSIQITGNSELPASKVINLDSLNILFNIAFLNSSLHPELNQSGLITLLGLPGSTVQAIVDFEDDGTFVVCLTPQCIPVSFVGGTFIFNVSSFTTYSTTIGGVNVTLTKTSSPDPVTAGSQLTYTITFTVTNGTAFNVTINDTYPAGITFDSATPSPDVDNNTWNAGNLTINESFQINITVNVSSSTSGTLNNTVIVTFQNSTSSNFSVNVSELTTVVQPSPGGGGGGGGGGRGYTNALICPDYCNESIYRNNYQCANCFQEQVCVEKWACNAWSECRDGNQARECFDSNKCGTASLKPRTEEACVIVPEQVQVERAVETNAVQQGAEYQVVPVEDSVLSKLAPFVRPASYAFILLLVVIAIIILINMYKPKNKPPAKRARESYSADEYHRMKKSLDRMLREFK